MTEIREDKVLEFKALTMNKRVFDQLDELTSAEELRRELDKAADHNDPLWVGRVNLPITGGHSEWFIVHTINGLTRVRAMTVWSFIQQTEAKSALDAGLAFGTDEFRERTNREATQVRYDNMKLEVSQVFLK